MPEWVVWENVPGALSSSHGEDFGCLLRELDALGYGLAWRVLDAQFFGLAQRRERLFVVGRLGDVERPCEVLFEPESLRWDTPTSREKRQELAARAGCRAACAGFKWHQESGAGSIGLEDEQSPTLTADYHNPAVLCIPENAINRPSGGTNGPMCYGPQEPSPTLRASKDVPAVLDLTGGEAQAHRVYGSDGIAPSLRAHGSGGNDLKVLCMTDTQPHAMVDGEVCGALSATMQKDPPVVAKTLKSKQVQGVMDGYVVRRLTPRECERLMGMPDDWTRVPYRGKPAEECPDTPRYRAIGNSMAVPVMRWIGMRIQEAES